MKKSTFYLTPVFMIWLTFLAAQAGLAQKSTNQVENLYKSGLASRSKAGSTTDIDRNIGYMQTAIEHFTEALKIEPHNIKVLLERATTYKMLFEPEPAMADCEQALKIALEKPSPNKLDLARIYQTRAEIYEYQDDYQNAIANYRLALKYNPANPRLTAALNENRLLAGEDVSDQEIDQAFNSVFDDLRKLPKPKNVPPHLKHLFEPKPKPAKKSSKVKKPVRRKG